MPHLSLRIKLLFAFGVVLLLDVVVSVSAYVNTRANAASDDWVRHTDEVIDAATNAELTVASMESSYREFLLTGSSFSAAAYRVSADAYPSEFDQLAAMTADNPPQVARWRAIEARTDQMRLQIMEPGIALRQRIQSGTATMNDVVNFDSSGSEASAMTGVRDSFAEAIGVERQLLTARIGDSNNSSAVLLGILMWGTLAAVLLGIAIAVVLARSIGDAMLQLVSAAQAIAQGDLGRRIALKRGDEIGQAAAAFDAMAETLQRDTAERLRVQAQTESILNSAAEGILGLDLEGRATIVNPTAVRLTGYSLGELRGALVHDLIHHSRPDGSPFPAADCPVLRIFQDRQTRHARDEVYWRKDGTCFPVEYTAVPISQNGETSGVVVTFHDISERLAVERMKDEFISVVSHELRTPLTSIRGSLGLLAAGLMGPISDKARHMLDVALSNTDRLIRLINDILDIERIESGRVPMEMRLVDAHELIHRSVESLTSVAESAGVTLREHAEPIHLVADPDRIVQTLTNLVSNAIKFSPSGSAIDVSVQREDTSVHFSVKDEGRGIPADKLERIFGRFEQVDASDSREKGGTGLGLAISRSIVLQHGGRIWVESTVGKGSTFHFVVPMGATSEATSEPEVETSNTPAVLIVDDDPDVLDTVSHMLAHEGYRPVGALNGEEAIALALADPPAAVLLDLAMPGMDGWQTMRALKAHPRTCDVPVLVLSGLERVRDERTQQTQGWITKPVTLEGLRNMLGHVVGRQSGPARILVVEDDTDLARVLRTLFVQYGVETQHARTGEEAVELSTWFEPDLLLLDLALPDRDGSEVVDWFRRHDRLRRVALVVYTARDLSEQDRDALQLGPSAHFTKSRISPEEVRRRVLSLLERVAPMGERKAS